MPEWPLKSGASVKFKGQIKQTGQTNSKLVNVTFDGAHFALCTENLYVLPGTSCHHHRLKLRIPTVGFSQFKVACFCWTNFCPLRGNQAEQSGIIAWNKLRVKITQNETKYPALHFIPFDSIDPLNSLL